MPSDFFQYVIPAVTGVVTGAIGSLVAPWVTWGIEKRKARLANRQKLLQECRAYILSDEYDFLEFPKTLLYTQLMPQLPPVWVKEFKTEYGKYCDKRLGSPEEIVITFGGRNEGVNTVYRAELLDEIAKLEKKWAIL